MNLFMSNDCHVIRLRGPWTYEAQGPDGRAIHGMLDFAGDWSEVLRERSGRPLLLKRRFGQPGNLDPYERVTLVIEGPTLAGAAIKLNDLELAPADGDSLCLDITSRLLPRNELELRFAALGDRPLLSEVRLEIRS